MRTAASILAGVCGATLIALAGGLLRNQLTTGIAAAALAAGAMIAAGTWFSFPKSQGQEPAQPWTLCRWMVVVTFALFALRGFCWLVFFDGDTIKFLSSNNLGDLSLHLTYINHLASGARFWPDNPIFAGEKLHYPIGTDLFNVLLTLVGIDVYRGLIWAGLAGALLTGLALHRWGGPFTLAGFLFNGGLAGFALLSEHQYKDFQADLAWKSIPLSMLVTQRGLLYALPVGALLLTSWRARYFRRENSATLPWWLELAFYATMPLFHLHTFVFLSLLLAGWLLLPGWDRQRQILIFLGSALVPAALLAWLVTGGPGATTGLHLLPGWMQGKQNFFAFWLLNFGVLPFLVCFLCVQIMRQRREEASAFVFPAVTIFLLACVVMLSRWEWDNTKLMIWSYLVILPFLWTELMASWNLPTRALCCVALFFSGFVSLLGGIDATHNGHKLAERSEVDGVRSATRDLDPNSTFAAFPTYNHPLLLTGHLLVRGYDGHLWSHGINYQQRAAELDAVMEGQEGWRELAEHLHVRYLFWGSREKEGYPDSGKPWTEEEPLATGSWGAIYDLQTSAAGGSKRD